MDSHIEDGSTVRDDSTDAISTEPEDDGNKATRLEIIIREFCKPNSIGLRKTYERHCRDPSKMTPRTLWALYLFRKGLIETRSLDVIRKTAIESILQQVPMAVLAKVTKPK